MWTSRKTVGFRKLKITLVSMTYHSQRPQCPSLSPHVLLLHGKRLMQPTKKKIKVLTMNSSGIINTLLLTINHYIKSRHEAGVTEAKDLVKGKSFLTYDKFLNKYKVKTHFLQYHALVGAIPNKWKKTVKHQSNNDETSDFNTRHKFLQKLSTKTAYNILISMQIEPPTAQSKILNSDNVAKENLPLYYSMPFVVTTETKLSICQYKIIHDVLPTNSLLFKMKITDRKCPLCQDQIPDIRHMFVKCPFVNTFWYHFHECYTFDAISNGA